jgi:hypothetical protein
MSAVASRGAVSKDKSGRDRRRHPRYEVRGIAAVLADSARCQVVRLSRSGCLASAPKEYPLDATVEVRLHLKGSVFRSPARVAFVGPDTYSPSSGRVRLGLEFLATPEASVELLDRFIRDELEGRVAPAM